MKSLSACHDDTMTESSCAPPSPSPEFNGAIVDNPGLSKVLPAVITAVERAGALLAAECVRPGGRRGFGDKADIDVEIETQLRAELLDILSCDWWGEETGHVLTGDAWCWVVDPNDGTSDFLKGLAGSAISVGLLHNNLPVLGVVHAPVIPSGQPDCIAWAEGMHHLLRNGIAVEVDLSQQRLSAGSMVMVSTAASNKPKTNRDLCMPADFYPMPSIAYRLALVAASDGVCGISLYPVSAHDVVAGHALLRGAKGVLVDQDGQPIEYNTKLEMLKVCRWCFGGAPRACTELASRDWARVFDNTAG